MEQLGAKLDSLSIVDPTKLNEKISSLLECIVCYEVMIPPIYQCKNSHQVCKVCKPRLDKCPCCKQPFLPGRSIFAEQISEHLFYPCAYSEAGCKERFQQKELQAHSKECVYRPYQCLQRKAGCTWQGRNSRIESHMKELHSEYAWMHDESSILYDIDILKGTEDHQLISAFHQIFCYSLKSDPVKKRMQLAVQYIGPKSLAADFTYEIGLVAIEDEEMTMTIKKRAHSDVEEFSSLCDSKKCITIDFEDLKLYLDSENNITFSLRIAKIGQI